MHEHHGQPRIGRHPHAECIVLQGRNVVQDMHARQRCAPHHLRLACIDGDPRACTADEALDNGHDAVQLFVQGYGIGARPGELAADIEDVGSLFLEPKGMSDGGLCGGELPRIGKAVRGDVDDAHDARPIQVEARDWTARRCQTSKGSFALLPKRTRLRCQAARLLERKHAPVGPSLAMPLDQLERGKNDVLAAGEAQNLVRRGVDVAWRSGDTSQWPQVNATAHAIRSFSTPNRSFLWVLSQDANATAAPRSASS